MVAVNMYIGQSEKQRRKKMIAIFIAPFYIALNIYLFWRIKGWVQAYFPKLKGKKGWIVPIVLYAFLASALVIAFFLPQGRFNAIPTYSSIRNSSSSISVRF